MIRSRARVLSVAVGALIVAAVLAGCAGEGGTAATATATTSPSASAESSPTPSEAEPSASVDLPTECGALGTQATRDETVGDMTLQSDGEGFVRPAPEGATLVLGCDWIVGDATGLLLLISTATPDAATAAVAGLPADGYSCQVSDDFGADFCVLPGEGADSEEMIVSRDGVWIYMSTVNRNGRAFLSEIVQGVFG